jgi:uncharacterized protein (TIGR02001 family)
VKTIKLLGVLAASTLMITPFTAHAATTDWDAEISANAGFVTEYSFRGIAQSDEHPAIQGGFDIAHDSGVYVGIWGSNVDFNDGDEASVEVDLYAGYSGSISNVNYDLGVIYYAYPGADSSLNYDFWEGSLALGYDFGVLAVSTSINYSPEYFGESGDAQYYSLNTDVPLAYDFTLTGHVGHQVIDDGAAFGIGDDSYTDWSFGLAYTWEGFDLSLQYIDTNLDEPGECADGCSERVIFGISRSF